MTDSRATAARRWCRKLGIKPDSRVLLVAAPPEFDIADIPPDAVVHRRSGSASYDVILAFCPDFDRLQSRLSTYVPKLTTAGALVAGLAEAASGVRTDIDENVVRDEGLRRRTRRRQGRRDRRDLGLAEVRPAAARSVTAEQWFLPAAERPVSAGNRVTPLVHGATYFARLVEVVSALRGRRPGLVHRLARRRRRAAHCGRADRRGAVRRARRSGASTYAHCCGGRTATARRSARRRTSVSAATSTTPAASRCSTSGSGAAARITRSSSWCVIATGPSDDVAFVGGIDLSHSRRDDSRHMRRPAAAADGSPLRRDSAVARRDARDPRPGGPRRAGVVRAALERPHAAGPSQPLPAAAATPRGHAEACRAAAARSRRHRRSPGPHTVQVLRTYAAKRPRSRSRRTASARSPGPTSARSPGRAGSIYIEDQYLWSDVVAADDRDGAAARAGRCRSSPSCRDIPTTTGASPGHPTGSGSCPRCRLLRDAGGDRFGAFDLQNPTGTPVYVHAKVCIVDDTWMSCGSDNFNRRSWTHDSELTCAVMDDDGPAAARACARCCGRSIWGSPSTTSGCTCAGGCARAVARAGRVARLPDPRPRGRARRRVARDLGDADVPHHLRPGRPAVPSFGGATLSDVDSGRAMADALPAAC